MSTVNNSRRSFLKKSAVVATGISIVPRHVLGKGFTAPSDKLNIAVIGGGGKGRSDAMNAWNKGASHISAICDVDWNMSKDLMNKFPKAKKFRDYRRLFDEVQDIDAVTVSTPDHTHAIITLTAMQLGKHVYVQKPLTHNIHEARVLTEAANKYKSVTQMGNQGASSDGTKQLIKWFDQGVIGKVNTVEVWTNRPVWPQGIKSPLDKPKMIDGLAWDVWVGPAKMVDYHPLYHPFKWRGWWNFGTGALGDMGCHLIDPPFRVLGLGHPTEVESSVGAVFSSDWTADYLPDSCPPSSRTQLKFKATKKNPVDVKLTWSDGGIRPFHPDLIPADHSIGNKDSSNGVLMIGEKGIMTCGTYGQEPKVYLNSGELLTSSKRLFNNKLPESGHQIFWTEACKAGFGSKEHKSLTSSFDYAGPLTESLLIGNLAIRSYLEKTGNKFNGRKKLLWDRENLRVTNFNEANKFVSRKYREGWKLEI
ncbi:Gfo/Idh/MocA family protein [Urechidicola vernalis]|uniref:Gfo/Idh/MocA family oxidoreductase n=1 Tax=Urechidicola vernalis TaxID=3075600 RepID=A0ABU2Y5T1_9FLAO|nr:Gfo/Idh/MocA family oxidoreductase [Urechidicola sp. P050]MDT0553568.1 Gfo/Idh/MocA family oxidoreductase [Urechidicola sp. P050]